MNIYDLKQNKRGGGKIVLYCAGLHGIVFKHLLESVDISVDFFCDNSKEKTGKLIDGVRCLAPEEVTAIRKYAVIVCIGIERYDYVYSLALEQGIKNIINYAEILDCFIQDASVLNKTIKRQFLETEADIFYSIPVKREYSQKNCVVGEKGKVAVYTACFGGYDEIKSPNCFPQNIDYYIISDDEPMNDQGYIWIDAKKVIPQEICSPVKRNRFAKMNPHLFFGEYEYSIYFDSNIQIVGDVTGMVYRTRSGISAFQHPRRDCLYYEALTMVNYKRVMPEDVMHQLSRYLMEGMPLHYGLTEMPFIVREHNKPICIKVMETWWHEFNEEAQRDQISFMYALWKNDLGLSDIGILGENVKEYEKLLFSPHNVQSMFVKNKGIY